MKPLKNTELQKEDLDQETYEGSKRYLNDQITGTELLLGSTVFLSGSSKNSISEGRYL